MITVGLHTLPMRTAHGEGAAAHIGALAAALGRRPLVVTDRGVVRAGHLDPAVASLRAAGLVVAVFDAVHENPTTADVAAGVDAARAHRADLLIGFGGGSSMDTAKGCNFIFTNGGRMEDYVGDGLATRPMLPFLAVPTTAGTGSECQRYALISDPVTRRKMACGDSKTRARAIILDPLLTLTQPPAVAACTGVDAVAHAVETAVTRARTETSVAYSRAAFAHLVRGLPRVFADPRDKAARADVQAGAALAGAAIELSMLGAAHAAANPLTARAGVVHGQAVGAMLPAVVRFNGADPANAAAYAGHLAAAGLECSGMADAPDRLAAWIEALTRRAGLTPLPAHPALAVSGTPTLAREAAAQWTAAFNPRTVDAAAFETLYGQVLPC